MRIKKFLLNILGFLALAIGSVGIVIPVLPTTPFVLLAAFCFSIGSPKINLWIQKSKHFGSFIENYKNHTGVPRRIKVQSIVFLWCGLVLSVILTRNVWVAIGLAAVGAAVTIHIHCLKSK